MASVAEKYPEEQQRLRELRDQYVAIGPPGAYGVALIDHALTAAERAMASGDIVQVITAFEQMRSITG